jgi:hypothetical protein
MRRLLGILGLVLILSTIMPAMTIAQDATPTLTRTNVRYVAPFGPDGLNPDLNVATTGSGVCGYESADAIGRPDAWDCISESDVIYDPCFENPYADPEGMGEVACFDSPFSPDVTVLTLTEPLVRDKEAATDQDDIQPWDLPWAVVLANGDRCTLLGGTLTVVAGETVHYGCEQGGSILGETDRSQPLWVVSYLPEGAFESSLVAVETAWS